jgi:hypothetical protein
MAQLGVVTFGCVEETDEPGPDDVDVGWFIGENPVTGDGILVTGGSTL